MHSFEEFQRVFNVFHYNRLTKQLQQYGRRRQQQLHKLPVDVNSRLTRSWGWIPNGFLPETMAIVRGRYEVLSTMANITINKRHELSTYTSTAVFVQRSRPIRANQPPTPSTHMVARVSEAVGDLCPQIVPRPNC